MYHCHILYTVYYAVWRLCLLSQESTVGERPAKYCHQPCSTICVVSLAILFKKKLQSPHSIKLLVVYVLIQEIRYGQHWFSLFAILLLRYRPHFWRLVFHLPAGTGRDLKNLSQVLYIFSWEGFVPRAWVLLAVSGQERCGPANDVSAAVKGRVSDRGTRFFVLVLLGGLCPRA